MSKKPMIVLAQDDPMLRHRLRTSLEGRNYDVMEAYDANSAIFFAEGMHRVKDTIDLLVIDEGLLVGGDEVEETMRRLYPNSKRVYIEKPIRTVDDLERFLKAVDEALAS